MMFDWDRPTSTSAALATFIFLILAKLFFLTANDFQSMTTGLLAVSLVELMLWVLLSGRKFRGYRSAFGYHILLVSLAAYSNIPLAMLANDLAIFPFEEQMVSRAMFAQSLMMSILYILFYLMLSRSDVRRIDQNINLYLDRMQVGGPGELLVAVIGLVISLIYFNNFVASGVGDMVGNASRIAITHAVETGKHWLVQYLFFAWLMVVATTTLYINRRSRPTALVILLYGIAISIFGYHYILIGNRREFALFLMYILLLSLIRQKKRIVLVGMLSVPLLLSVGVFRALQGDALGEIETPTVMLQLFGEFVFPNYPLIYYSSHPPLDLMYGLGYIRFPLYVLPDFGLWQKAPGFAVAFSEEYAGRGMGFAFTPLAEGFLNFGWCGVLLTPLLMVLTFKYFDHVARQFPIGWVIAISLSLDICRGEFSAVLAEWLLFSVTFIVIIKISELGRRPIQ